MHRFEQQHVHSVFMAAEGLGEEFDNLL
jgi:hypothetical protein